MVVEIDVRNPQQLTVWYDEARSRVNVKSVSRIFFKKRLGRHIVRQILTLVMIFRF